MVGMSNYLKKEVSSEEYYKITGCHGKKAYNSYDEALKQKKWIRKKAGAKLDTYNCRFCGYWHLGHRSTRRRREYRRNLFKVVDASSNEEVK